MLALHEISTVLVDSLFLISLAFPGMVPSLSLCPCSPCTTSSDNSDAQHLPLTITYAWYETDWAQISSSSSLPIRCALAEADDWSGHTAGHCHHVQGMLCFEGQMPPDCPCNTNDASTDPRGNTALMMHSSSNMDTRKQGNLQMALDPCPFVRPTSIAQVNDNMCCFVSHNVLACGNSETGFRSLELVEHTRALPENCPICVMRKTP